MHFIVENMRNGYVRVCKEVILHGAPVSPRGVPTREIIGAQIVVQDIADTLPVGVGRKLATRFAAVEAIQLIAGVSNVEKTIEINPNMERFLNHTQNGTGYFHGAYGPRIKTALRQAVDRIKNDPFSRQALVNIWDKTKDLDQNLKDVPCTLTLHFMVRKDGLKLITSMRSNDIYWGLAYDVFQFTQLQWTVANVLGIPPSTYIHNANSLHMYDRDINAIEELHESSSSAPEWHPTGFDGDTIAHAQQRAWMILENSAKPLFPSEDWYHDKLHS